MAIDAKVDAESALTQGIAASRMRTENGLINFNVDITLQRKPQYYVHVFNVGKFPMKVNTGMIKNYNVPTCKDGEEYVRCFTIPDVVTQAWQDPDNQQVRTFSEDGRRVAMDLINPTNMGLDQDVEFRPEDVVSQGSNLAVWGLFWSLNDPPTREELAKAKKRMEKHYRTLMQQADGFSRINKPDQIQEYHHVAADYFGYAGHGNWHVALEAPAACPNCGENIKKGVAFHRIDEHTVCVIDWDRTIAAGVKTEKDRPRAVREI